MNQKTVLVVEDDQEQRTLVSELLTNADFSVHQADSVEGAIVYLQQHQCDLIFCDWKLGQLSGLELLNYVQRNEFNSGFVIATAYGTISHAVEAMKLGADDYLSKPFKRQELLLSLDKAYKAKSLRSENQCLSEQLAEQKKLIGIVGKAQCMQQVYHRINKVSNTNATVLILGESGTGKELCARALHEKSLRSKQRFVAINCGAIAESLAESELFGAEKGAYTSANTLKIGHFEAANYGTVFLDEIGELSLNLQTKLLRFLQEGTITRLGSNKEMTLDVRVIAATHRNIATLVKEGHFREDLYYRLNVVPITMPPLRQRQSDIALLADYFIQQHARQHNVTIPKLESNDYRCLLEYHWPGNVRELSNRIERFVLLEDRQELLALEQSNQTQVCNDSEQPHFNFPSTGFNWQNFERVCLQQALVLAENNKTKAAELLQLPYKAFLYRLDKYQIGMSKGNKSHTN